MPHIHTQPGQHDYTVTLYIIRTDTPEPRAWLHMHKKMGIILPVGGHIELDETPWQAAAHELEEESGYNPGELKILQPKDRLHTLSNIVLHPYPIVLNTHPITSEHLHTDIAYAFVATGGPTGTIDKGESSDIRWLTKVEMNSLSEPEMKRNTQEVYNFIFDVCLKHWEKVPASVFVS